MTDSKHFKVHTVYNSVDTALFAPGKKAASKAELGFPEDSIVVMFAAFHLQAPRKGLQVLLSALRGFDSHACQLLFVGEAPPDLQEIKQNTFCTGTVDDSNRMAALYQAADIVVVPSLSDNLPNVILEAMSSGNVVVASDLAGIPELVKHKKTGMLYPPKCSEKLAECLSTLFLDAELRDTLSKNSREFALQNLSVDVERKRYVNIYKDLCG